MDALVCSGAGPAGSGQLGGVGSFVHSAQAVTAEIGYRQLTIRYNRASRFAHNGCMNADGSNPFRWYVGRTVTYRDRPHVVEGSELDGRHLLFRLRPIGPGCDARVTMLELLDLVEAQRH